MGMKARKRHPRVRWIADEAVALGQRERDRLVRDTVDDARQHADGYRWCGDCLVLVSHEGDGVYLVVECGVRRAGHVKLTPEDR